MQRKCLLMIFIVTAIGCAGPNPNPGERTADIAWTNERYYEAISTIKPKADIGEPWAQLRMGLMYERGWGVEKSIPIAVEYFEKAAAQKDSGGWAEGIMIGFIGKSGYFNQNSDARIAQYCLANLYFKGEGITKDLEKAYINIKEVVDETEGRSIFFCCEFAGGSWFPAEWISNLYEDIRKEMSEEEIKMAEEKYELLTNKKK